MKRREPSSINNSNNNTLSQQSKKVRRPTTFDEDDEGLDDATLFEISDTMAAILSQLKRYGPDLPTEIPVTLLHHLYSVVKDRSVVDREIHQARAEGKVRLVQANTGPSERIVILESDYLRFVERMIEERCKTDQEKQVLRLFIDNVLKTCHDLSISASDLRKFLGGIADNKASYEKDSPEFILTKMNLLVRRVDVFEANSYWFTLPKLGDLIGIIKDGREQILSTIKRKRENEMLQRELVTLLRKRKGKGKASKDTESKKAKGTTKLPRLFLSKSGNNENSKTTTTTTCLFDQMGLEYHIMDAIYAGELRSIQTGMGPLLKIVNK